jgi:hypothetical protein
MREPTWLDLGHGVRLRVAPLTTALMVAARSDAAVEALQGDAPDEVRALAFAKALAVRAILDWEGVGDAGGAALPPSPEAIGALLELYPLFEAFQLGYMGKGLALAAEKNVCAPSPTGTSAGASATAKRARRAARTARRG